VTDEVRAAFVIAPHHPDRLRRPLPAGIAAGDDPFRHALTWNVFRTLELIAPSFWLRRLHVRLTGAASLLAPQVVSVRLWPELSLPPIRRIDGTRAGVVADVVIETEHDVWTILVPPDRSVETIATDAADVLDAGGWLAGRRSHHSGVIERDASNASAGLLLKQRYGRSRESAALRSAARGPATPAGSGWGRLSWPDLAAVLADCAGARNLPAIERTLAANAVDWLHSVGIEPAD
jgi:hypothetical protein